MGGEDQDAGQQEHRAHQGARLGEQRPAERRGQHRAQHEAQLVGGLLEGVRGVQGRRIAPVQIRPAGPRHPAGVRGRRGRGVRGEQRPGRGVVVDAQHQGQRPQHGERGGGHGDARLSEAVHQPGGEGRDDRCRGQAGRGDGPGEGVRAPGPGDHDDRADAEHPHRQPGDQIARREGAGPGRRQQPEVRIRRRPLRGRTFTGVT